MQTGVPDELAEFVPQFRVLQLKVKFTPPEELTAGEHPFRWVLRVIQAENAGTEELEAALMAAVDHIETLSDVDRLSWERALSFLLMLVLHRRDPVEAQPMVTRAAERVSRRHREEATEMAKTAAQALIEEGEARGVTKGILKTKRDDLLMLMRRKFGAVPETAEARVCALEDTEKLDVLLGRILDVDTVEAMGL